MNNFYTLTNPLCQILDKNLQDFTRQDFLNVILERQIERITFHYIGLDGKLKELKIIPQQSPTSREDPRGWGKSRWLIFI